MTEREVTRYETVEKTDTVKVCDSCGTDETEIPDDAGEFHTVYEDVSLTTASDQISSIYYERVRVRGLGHQTIYMLGERSHLCPICYGAMLGKD